MSNAAPRPTHRIGPQVHRISARDWTVDSQIILPKSGRPYRRSLPSARTSQVRKEIDKIKAKGTPSVVVSIAGVIDEDLYEGKDLIPKGSFVVLSRRVATDSLVTSFDTQHVSKFDTQSSLVVGTFNATDFKFSSIKSVYIREDRIG